MKKRHSTATTTHARRAVSSRQSRTGEHCPLNGWWAPAGREADRRYIAQGSILPADDGESVIWTLVEHVPNAQRPKYALPPAGVFIDHF